MAISLNSPNWHEGIEFGKPRNDTPDYKPLSKKFSNKLVSLYKKQDKLILKIQTNTNAQVSVKIHTMSKTKQVTAQEALSILSEMISKTLQGIDTYSVVYV